MDNNNASDSSNEPKKTNAASAQSGVVVNNTIHMSSAPTSSTPTQSSVNATAPVSKKDNKKAIIIACIVIGVCILVSVVFTLISKASAQRRLDETIEICEENGLLSTKCKDAQTKNKVTCKITGECEAEYHRFLIF